MTIVIFVSADGESEGVDATPGLSLADAAISNGIRGISGDCGGACACGTCHVYVDPEWFDRLPPITSFEADLLSCLENRRLTSRLACQIKVVEEISGFPVEIPY